MCSWPDKQEGIVVAIEIAVPIDDAESMSEPSPPTKCQICANDIPEGRAVFLPQESLHESPLIICRDCGDLDIEVDP